MLGVVVLWQLETITLSAATGQDSVLRAVVTQMLEMRSVQVDRRTRTLLAVEPRIEARGRSLDVISAPLDSGKVKGRVTLALPADSDWKGKSRRVHAEAWVLRRLRGQWPVVLVCEPWSEHKAQEPHRWRGNEHTSIDWQAGRLIFEDWGDRTERVVRTPECAEVEPALVCADKDRDFVIAGLEYTWYTPARDIHHRRWAWALVFERSKPGSVRTQAPAEPPPR